MNDLSHKLTNFLGSRRFWYVVLGFFLFEALWFVFSAVYPMAFDEDFHLGVIRIYAEHWSPFLTIHPQGADQFGAVVRDPSYLYHYLMSFPYRLLVQLTDNMTVQVIVLRLLNVALFTGGLLLFRKVMLRAKASPALTHTSLALFILIPIVPQLAAHINYDNLLMVMLPLMCLTVFNLTDSFRKGRIDVAAALGFLAICLYMCVVKYAALPFLVGAVVFLFAMFMRYFWGRMRTVGPAIWKDTKQLRRPILLTLVAICLLGTVLFVQRYGVNVARYKTPVPDCGKVLTVEQCVAYGPWGRDYYFEQARPSEFNPNPLAYMSEWLEGMWFRTFFAVSGPASNFTNYPPLVVPAHTAVVVLIFGVVASVFWWRRLFIGDAYLVFFVTLIGVYCAILWFDQYGMYRQTAQPVAINGRYLLPILPLLAVVLGRGFSSAINSVRKPLNRTTIKAAAATLTIVLFLHGGGVFTFILRSDSTWYWPNAAVRKVNEASQKVLAPITIEGSKYY
jgi:hypothetical protein